MTEILFAEDEEVLGLLVKEALERDPNYKIRWVRDGQEAFIQFNKQVPDICILDVMMPVTDGYTLAKQIRAINPDIPIIFLTARSQTADVVKGFESGGNDYLKKPFSIEELAVRVRALLQRHSGVSTNDKPIPDRYEIGHYIFIPATQTLRCQDASYQLSNKEAILLKALVINKNNVLDRKEALMAIWGDDNFFNARNMDVYIGKLRKYLAHDTLLSIVNIRGFGFKLIEQQE